jgi:hypothetical protein
MDIATILGLVTAVSTCAFASLAIYNHMTRTRLKIVGYRKMKYKDITYYSAVIKRKGKMAAKGCRAQVQINDYRYNATWPSSWNTEQDILESEELELFNIDEVQGKITFMIGNNLMRDLPLDEHKNKILKIVVTSENADGTSDRKTVSEIMRLAKLIPAPELPLHKRSGPIN